METSASFEARSAPLPYPTSPVFCRLNPALKGPLFHGKAIARGGLDGADLASFARRTAEGGRPHINLKAVSTSD